MSSCITLTGDSLTLADVVAVARHDAAVEIAPDAAARADRSRARIEAILATGRPVYGVNTGFGRLEQVRIAPERLVELQRNLIVSHVAGVGSPLPVEAVRAAMLLRANVLLRETAGVRATVVRLIAGMLNAGIHPVVPEQGSVGASGDLAPLAHIAYAMMGEGEVMVGGTGNGERGTASGLDGSPFPVSRSPARDALLSAGLEPIDFQAKEGIAFINGTQVQTATLAVAVHDARVVWRSAVGAAAMTLEALMGTPTPFDERIHAVRPHPGQVEAARLLRKLLADSRIRDSHRDGDPRVQDAYSLRCTPQILGAVHDAIAFARHTAEIEINASTDNPLLFGDELLSGGNFHGQPIALALDVLAIALATLAGLAERRLERVVNPDLSHGLPPFLSRDAGVGSGLMMLQVTAAALAGECRTLAAPASVHSIPTDANQEDVVPMGMTAAWKARRVLANATRVVACELIAGAQGLEFRKPLEPGRGVRALYARVRELVPALDRDRPLSPDMERVADAVAREMFL